MEKIISKNVAASLILLFLDFLWISLFMGKKYQSSIQKIQNSKLKPKLLFAFLAYVLMIIGLNVFVLPNIRKNHELEDSLKYGFLFGIVLYGVYDMTSASVISDWDIGLSFVDTLWGGFVFFISAYLSSIMIK